MELIYIAAAGRYLEYYLLVIILTTRQYHKYFQNAILYVGYTRTYEGAIEQILRGISSSDWYITGGLCEAKR